MQFVYNFPFIGPLCRVWVCFYWFHHVFPILSVILTRYHYTILTDYPGILPSLWNDAVMHVFFTWVKCQLSHKWMSGVLIKNDRILNFMHNIFALRETEFVICITLFCYKRYQKVIRSSKSKDRQCNCQKVKQRSTKHYTKKLKIEHHELLKAVANSGAPER
jgi:hypothetical protein